MPTPQGPAAAPGLVCSTGSFVAIRRVYSTGAGAVPGRILKTWTFLDYRNLHYTDVSRAWTYLNYSIEACADLDVSNTPQGPELYLNVS